MSIALATPPIPMYFIGLYWASIGACLAGAVSAGQFALATRGNGRLWLFTVMGITIAGYQAFASNQVSAVLGAGAEHGIVFAYWPALIVAMWGAVEIISDIYTLKDQGMIEIGVTAMADIAGTHGQCFAKGTGATIV